MAKGITGRPGSSELSTIIGSDAILEGRLEVKNSMRIDGRVKGDLVSTETITIGSGGMVDGNLSAKDIVVGGRVTGKLEASGRITLEEKAVLVGDLKAARLVVEEGAVFDGRSEMGGHKPHPHQPPLAPRPIKLTED